MITRVLVIAAIAALSVPAFGEDAVRTAIDARNKEWTDAFNRGDAAGVLAIYDQDAVMIPSASEPITNRSEQTKLMASATQGYRHMSFKTHSLTVVDGYAYELGRSSYEEKNEKGEWVPAHDDYLVIWKKDANGTWNYHVDTWWRTK